LRIALNLREGGVMDEEVDDVQSNPKSPISAKQKLKINNRRIDDLEAKLKKLREDLNKCEKPQPSPCKVSLDEVEDNHCEPNPEKMRDLAIVPCNEPEKVSLDVDRKLARSHCCIISGR